MSFTAQLGKSDSRPGNIILGGGAGSGSGLTFNVSATDTFIFSDQFTGFSTTVSCSDTFIFSDALGVTKLNITDVLNLSDSVSVNNILLLAISDTLTFSEVTALVLEGNASDTLIFSDEMVGVRKLDFSATDALSIVESLTTQLTGIRTLAEGLEFVESAQRNIIKLLTITDSLTLSDVAIGLDVKLAQDVISFTEDLQYFTAKLIKETLEFGDITNVNINYTRNTADVFEPYDAISVELFIRRTFEETLTFGETLTGERVTPIGDSLTFSETIDETVSKTLSDTLSFVDTAAVIYVRNVSTSDLLNFSDSMAPKLIISKALTEALSLIESIQSLRVRFYDITDSFAFSDLLVREIRIALAPDTLTFIEDLVVNRDSYPELTDTLVFIENLAVNTIISQTLTDSLSFFERPPSDLLPNTTPDTPVGSYGIVYNKLMTLNGKTRSIVLPPPEFNDFYTDRNQVIFKRRMNGAVATYVKTGLEQKLHYEYILSKPKADELRSFLDAEHSNLLVINDWNGYIWLAKMSTDNIDKEEIGRWEPCGNKTRVTIEFIGKRYA